MKSVKYLDMAIAKLGLKNDFALTKELGWSSGQMSQYRTGKRVMDDEACIAIALVLNIHPMDIIGAACLDRAEKTGQKSLWEVFMTRTAAATASAALAISVNLFLTPHDVEAAELQAPTPTQQGHSLYYVKFDVSRHCHRGSAVRAIKTVPPSAIKSITLLDTGC